MPLRILSQPTLRTKDEDGILNPTQELAKNRYKWLEQNFPDASDAIKKIKESINSSAHSNIADANRNFNFDAIGRHFDTPFFDFEDDHFVKSDLWIIANVAMGLMRSTQNVNPGDRSRVKDFGQTPVPA